MISKKSKVFVAGHNGMIGSAILRKLQELTEIFNQFYPL